MTILPWYARWLALAALCAAFGVWCYVHGMQHTQARWDAEKVTMQAQLLKSEQANRAKESQLKQQVIEAQNDAKKRETKLAADAADARAESGRLRNSIATIRAELPSLAADAVRRYADTTSIVLGECQDRYSELAETADRLDSDRQTLGEAWPR
jgi:uncharacterized iron-regulated membrane protein